MNRRLRRGEVFGLILVFVYTILLLAPPAASWPTPPPEDAGLWERIFCGVPQWWSITRILCLFMGAGLLALSSPLILPIGAERASREQPTELRPGWVLAVQYTALFLAAAHAGSGFFAAHFERRAEETVYFAFLAVPAAVLALTEIERIRNGIRSTIPMSAVLVAMPTLWVAWSIPTAWRSPRAASVVDGWLAVERFTDTVLGQRRVLMDSADPGFSNAYMMLEGISLFSPDRLRSAFVWLQTFHFFWTIVCALAIGVLAWRMIGLAAAVVAQAVFLFSPFVLSFPLDPLPIFLGPLCTVVLLLLIVAVRECRSGAALALFGAVAGFSGRIPQLTVITLLLCVVLTCSLRRTLHNTWLAAACAVCSCAAAVIPGLPNARMLEAMRTKFAVGRGQLAGMLTILYGQETPFRTREAMNAGHSSMLDIPIGALLAPFANARMPIRWLGDTLLDPVGTVLMTAGLFLCVLHAKRNRSALLLIGLLVASFSTAFVSSGDAVSPTRLVAALVPLALLGGVGFEALRARWTPLLQPEALAAITALVIAIAGIWIFASVNPRILPASSLHISLEALGATEQSVEPTFLEHGGNVNFGWLHVRRIAEMLPARSIRVLTTEQFEREEVSSQVVPSGIYFWSPGIEQERALTRTVCEHWPQSALYTLMDRPKLFRALAASPRGATWHPALPDERWSITYCDKSPH